MNDTQQDILNDFTDQPKAATVGKRIAAALIDGLILLVVLIIMSNLFGERYEQTTTTTTTVTTTIDQSTPTTTREVSTSSGFHLEGWPVLAFMVCWFFLVPYREGTDGQTIGKTVLRIKVVGLIIALTNPQQKRIGDLVAGTYVVEKS